MLLVTIKELEQLIWLENIQQSKTLPGMTAKIRAKQALKSAA